MDLATGLRIQSYASVDYRVLPPAGIEPLTLSVEGGAPRPLGYGTPSHRVNFMKWVLRNDKHIKEIEKSFQNGNN